MNNTLVFALITSLLALLMLISILLDGFRYQLRRSRRKFQQNRMSIPLASSSIVESFQDTQNRHSDSVSVNSAQAACPVTLLPDTDIVFQGQSSLLSAFEEKQVEIVQGSCRTGSCGTCKVRLVKGQVRWLIHPEFRAGEQEILSCCCVPVGPVTLEPV